MQTILITGAAGYIGSLLCKRLSQNYNIIAVDNLLYDQGILLYEALKDTYFYILDVDDIPDYFYKMADIVIPLAAYTGMPACKKNETQATRVNLNNIQNFVTKLNKDQLIIYPNTNSGYGFVKDKICDENTLLKAISHYGQLKNQAEKVVLSHNNSIVFRLATVFGYSYRHRIDLLVNTLVYEAYFYNNINLFDNDYCRNYVHILDVVNAFEFAINNVDKMRNQVYNIGNDKLNTTKQIVAEKVLNVIPSATINSIKETDPDQRNYKVSSQKIYDLGFKPQYNFAYGINQLLYYYKMLPKDQSSRNRLINLMRNDN